MLQEAEQEHEREEIRDNRRREIIANDPRFNPNFVESGEAVAPENLAELRDGLRRATVANEDARFDDRGEPAKLAPRDEDSVDLPGAPPDADLPYAKLPPDEAALCEGDIALALRIFRKEGEIFPLVINMGKWPLPHVFEMPAPGGLPKLVGLIHELSRKAISTYLNPNSLKQSVQDELRGYVVTNKSAATSIPRGIDENDFETMAVLKWDVDAHDDSEDNQESSTVKQYRAAIEGAKLLQDRL